MEESIIDTLGLFGEQIQSNIHTSTVAKITAVNGKTISCKPVVNRVVDGQSIELPEFVEVPPIFLCGGDSHIAMPIKAGDYCLLIFSERCFDRWYHGQDFMPPLELRMHDYSDGFALVGLKSFSGAINIPENILINGDTDIEGNVIHDGDYTLNGNLTVNGNITATGTLSAASMSVAGAITCGSISVNGSDYASHRHTTTQEGNPTSTTI